MRAGRSRSATSAGRLVFVALLLLAGAGLPAAQAQQGTDPGAALRKLHPRLRGLVGQPPPPPARQGPLHVDHAGRVHVHVLVTPPAPEVVELIAVLGGVVDRQADGVVQAWLPVDALEGVAGLAAVRAVRPPAYLRPSAGSATTEGDALLGLAGIRQQLGLTGTGVRVGVLSTGLAGLPAAIASGDLPATTFHCRQESMPSTITLRSDGCQADEVLVETSGGVTGQSFGVDADLAPAGSAYAEGTALLEIVHDLAPGAELWFASLGVDLSALDFQAALAFLGANTDVVVSDLVAPGYFPNGQSTVAQQVAAVVGNASHRARAWVQAAGNQADLHYAGTWVDSGVGDEFGPFHEFRSIDGTIGPAAPRYSNTVSVAAGETIDVFLSWDDPAGASTNDYDLLLVTGEACESGVVTDADVLSAGVDPQEGPPDEPSESVWWTNDTGDAATVCYLIQNYVDTDGGIGPAAPRMLNVTVHVTGGGHLFNTPARSLLVPADVGGDLLTVGAVDVASPSLIQSYSSRGPTFDGRPKPDLVATDGVSVSGAGGFPGTFFGTSAATPHVAGLAALLLELNPTLTRAQLRGLLTTTAVPLGDASTYGAGRIDALAAALAAPPPALAAAVLPVSRAVQVGTPATAFATIINLGPGPAEGCGLALPDGLAWPFTWQITDAQNLPVGPPGTPVDLAAGDSQSFVFAVTPTIAGTHDLAVRFDCVTTEPAPAVTGLDTLLLVASDEPVPDIVALAVTASGDGIVRVADPPGSGAFAVATVNVGVAGTVHVSADTGGATLPVALLVCETDPVTGLCADGTAPAATVVTTIGAGATSTFTVYVQATGDVAFVPAASRVFLRFAEVAPWPSSGAMLRGATSVAVCTGALCPAPGP